jgi:hypothetical protein
MAAINTLIFSSIMMATAVSPLYENPWAEEIIFRRLDSTSISLPPQAVRYEQTISLVYANPELPSSMSTPGKTDNQGV